MANTGGELGGGGQERCCLYELSNMIEFDKAMYLTPAKTHRKKNQTLTRQEQLQQHCHQHQPYQPPRPPLPNMYNRNCPWQGRSVGLRGCMQQHHSTALNIGRHGTCPESRMLTLRQPSRGVRPTAPSRLALRIWDFRAWSGCCRLP
ncbi:unnamed protein product [Ectocarpus sp. 12 AP-2014]